MRGLESKTDFARKTQLILLDQLGLDLAVQVDGRLLLERLLVLCFVRLCMYVVELGGGSQAAENVYQGGWGAGSDIGRRGAHAINQKQRKKKDQKAELVQCIQDSTNLSGRLEAQPHIAVVAELATPPISDLLADDRNGRLHLETTLSLTN